MNENKIMFNQEKPYVVFALRMPGFTKADSSRTDLSGSSKQDLLYIYKLVEELEEQNIQVVFLGASRDKDLGTKATFKYNRCSIKDEREVLSLVQNSTVCICFDAGGLGSFATYLSHKTIVSIATNPWRADSFLSENGYIIYHPSTLSPEQLVKHWEDVYDSKRTLEFQAGINIRDTQNLCDPNMAIHAHLRYMDQSISKLKSPKKEIPHNIEVKDSSSLGLKTRLERMNIMSTIVFTQNIDQ